MMIDFLLALLSESPLLFTILMANLAILAYIIFRISMYVIRKKSPGRTLSRFVWKIKLKKEKEEIGTLEGVYAFVMEGMRKEGLLEKDEKTGFRSRKKVIEKMPEGRKKEVLKSLFDIYEAKVYGNRRIKDEKTVVADILDGYSKL
jgi:hypothetical protein